MSRIEVLDRESWNDFLESDVAVLMLAKSDCAACKAWTEELEAALGEPGRWAEVRFAKLVLDQPGLGRFKKSNPWLTQVDALPFNVIYKHGERVKSFAGGGLERLENRLRRVVESA